MSAPERFGRYRVIKPIGEGGMGEVFLAELSGAHGFSKLVAIKRLRPGLSDDFADALLAEARVAKRLQHGNIVQVHDFGSEDAGPYVVVEYVEGPTLAELTRSSSYQHGRLPVADALYVVEQLAAALEYAHTVRDDGHELVGVVHRDVKPANVLLSRDGVVKLADFGIAKALSGPASTLPGMIKGTVGYLSPEQAHGGEIDARSDQYAVGLVLYELLTGSNPLAKTENLAEYLALLEVGLPRLAGDAPIDDDLADIVARATSAAATDRYESMGEMRSDLEAWRVKREIRIGPATIREAVRTVTAQSDTVDARPLEVAFGARGSHTAAATLPQRPTQSNSRLPGRLAAAAAVIAIAAATAWWLSRSSAPTAVTTDAAVPQVTIDATVVTDAAALDGIASPDAAAVSVDASSIDAATAAQNDAASKPPPGREPGTLMVNVLPWANVYVDGKLRGPTPLEISLSAGKHTVLLENPELDRQLRRRVVLKSGKQTRITSW